MKRRFFILVAAGLAGTWLFFFFPRPPVIGFLKVNTGLPATPDLLAVLGGGITPDGNLGNSTRERLDAVSAYVRRTPGKYPILVQEYPAGRRKMVAYLLKKGVRQQRFLSSGFHYRERSGGTENNIAELFSVLREHKGVSRVVLVTSPYHQRRVGLMIRSAEKQYAGHNVHFYFLQLPRDGEIVRCSRFRFWRLVGHEMLGIIFYQLKD